MKLRYDVDIEEGSHFANAFGDYRVVAINPKTKIMSVLYLNGVKEGCYQELDMIGQAKVIHNQMVREEAALRMSKLNLQNKNEAFTLGFLSLKCFVCVRVKEANRIWFDTTYKKLTGISSPTPNIEGNYYTVSPDHVEGCGDYLHVGFETPPDYIKPILSFGDNERSPLWDSFGTLTKYNSSNYVLNLFGLGFRLGKDHEVDMIRNNVEDKEAFDKGYFFECDPQFESQKIA